MITKRKHPKNTEKLEKRYKKLTEKAYNFRFTNTAVSDTSAYKAMLLLERINRIKYGYQILI